MRVARKCVATAAVTVPPPGHHKLALLIGGGLLGGIALATLRPKVWSRVGAVLFGSGAWLARSPVGPALLGALWTNILSNSTATCRPVVVSTSSAPPSA